MKEQVGTVDLTPSWQGLVPALIMAIESHSQIAREELSTMAGLADQRNAICRVLSERPETMTDTDAVKEIMKILLGEDA